MANKLSKNLDDLNHSAKEYVKTKIDLAKITLLEKSTKLSSFLIAFWILVTFLCWVVVFLAAAFAVWYGMENDNFQLGLLIAAGILFCFGLLIFLLRNQLVSGVFIRNYSKIIFEEDDENESY